MARTVPDPRPIRCHSPGCRADVAWQVMWVSNPADFRLTCTAHAGAALQPGQLNHAMPYPFATPSQEDVPCP